MPSMTLIWEQQKSLVYLFEQVEEQGSFWLSSKTQTKPWYGAETVENAN